MNDPNIYPKGWDRARVEAVIAHHDALTDEELAEEYENDPDDSADIVLMSVPADLVPAVRKLIAQHDAGRVDAAISS